jgi:hypothetical protein
MHPGPAPSSGHLFFRNPGPAAQGQGAAGGHSPAARTPAAGDCALLALSPGEWALAAPRPGARPGAAELRGLARSLARAVLADDPGTGGGDPGPVVRVPGQVIGPCYGAALYHHCGRTMIYCPDGEVTRLAVRALSALVTRSGMLTAPGPASEPRTVAVTVLPHRGFAAPFHPATAVARGRHCGLYVCSRLITPSLAADIARLCAAQAALSARPR